MNFVDIATVSVVAGKGGSGAVSFRHEKFIDRGGPDGGDGGDGGSVIFVASESENTLANFRFQKELIAEDGQPGTKSNKHGRNGRDLVVKVPVGTQITADGKVVADLVVKDESAVIASGGRGGFGNAHFTSSVRQAPKFAEKGEPGEAKKLILELKMIADVGLVGLPNAGKSTLLARLSNAKPEIADYPFTTLTPNLGVVDVDGKDSLLFADIPGLIEGAASGKGLGHEFLRHVERTAVLIHMIDAYQVNLTEAYQTIQSELIEYHADLDKRSQIIAVNKTEGLSAADKGELTKSLKKLAPKAKILAISAKAGMGLEELKRAALAEVKKYRSQEKPVETEPDKLPVIKLKDASVNFEIEKVEDGFRVSGPKIDKFAARTDFTNDQAIARLKNIMQKQGIMHELFRRGAELGDVITVSSGRFNL